MKKFLLVSLVAVLGLSLAFAAAEPKLDGPEYDGAMEAFLPTNPRNLATGGCGAAAPGRMDSLFFNPAALAAKRFGMSLPSVGITINNLQKLFSNEKDAEALANLVSGASTDQDMIQIAQDLITNLGSGKNELLALDASVGTNLPYFGFGAHVQAKINSWAKGSANLANISLIPEINVAAELGFAFPIIKTDAINLDLGASAMLVYKAYMKALAASTILPMVQGTGDTDIAAMLLWNTPVMGGFAVPVNVGLNLGFFSNTLRVGVVASGINSVYKMKSFTGAGDLVNSIMADTLVPPEGREPNEPVEFEIKHDMDLTIGLAYAPKLKILHPVIEANLVDMIDLFTGKEEFEWDKLLLHLNAGAELNLLNFIAVRAGVNRGYLGIGVGLMLPVIGVEASYAWREFGPSIGDKPVDTFTVRINIGYDKI